MPLNKLNLFKNSGIDQQTFLKDYWHKKPLLLENAVAQEDLGCIPNKQQLMDMSCEDDIQSRVVFKQSDKQYHVELGPFVKQDLVNFDDYCWNLLISDVDKWQPKSRGILKYFGFIRNWILDDIMLSTGSKGGTVGPHTDHYDVFLVQVSGQRQWQYSFDKFYNPALMPDLDLKLMRDFKADNSFTLNPGDVLYLPPEVAHYGIAIDDDCVTCSVGIRTPSDAELLTAFVDEIAQNIDESRRFIEPEFSQQPHSGEITSSDLTVVSKLLNQHLKTDNIQQWFGKFITQYRSIFYEFNQHQNTSDLELPCNLITSPFSKVSYIQQKGNASVFVNGESYITSLKLAQFICNEQTLFTQQYKQLNDEDKNVIKQLYENGSIIKIKAI